MKTIVEDVEPDTRLGFHLGNVLKLLADRYPKLQRMILEQIQNALDANATRITVRVDLKDRDFEIWDNGDGASREEMAKSFAELGKGRKKADKFGRFGIGVVSAFGKGDCFTFTSCAKNNEDTGYFTWTFDTSEILHESQGVIIPCEPRPDLMYWPDDKAMPPIKFRSKTRVPWRTKVKATGLRRDARLCHINLNALKAEIVSNFGKRMLELEAVVKIRFTNEEGLTSKVVDVAAESYSGNPLPVEKMVNQSTGNMFFRFYLARSTAGKRNGIVNVSIIGNPFRIDARTCFSGLVPSLIDKETFEDIVSGVFEGDIECENLTLKAERDGFADDDALMGLCLAIEEWHKKIGLKHVMEIQNSKQESLFQETGIKAMQFIEALCRHPEYQSLVSYLKIGTIGKRHKDGPTVGTTSGKELSADGGPIDKRNGEDSEGHRILQGTTKKRKGEEERRGHIPGTVSGPRGIIRRQVKGHSVGLRFEYAQLTSDSVYEFDIDTGLLTFNYSHEYWQICEVSKSALARYQATVAEIVLVLLPYVTTDQYELQLDILLDKLALEVHRIVDGDAFFTERKLKRHTL